MRNIVVGAFAGLATLGLLASTQCATEKGATNATNAVSVVAHIGVEVCQEAPQLTPPGAGSALVSLLCATYDSQEQKVQVLIDSVIWSRLKVEYMNTHDGGLPPGVNP